MRTFDLADSFFEQETAPTKAERTKTPKPKFLKIFTSEYKFTRNGEEFTYTFDEDATFNTNATNLLMAMGVELETIEQIRTIMIPGYEAGVTQETELENKGWH